MKVTKTKPLTLAHFDAFFEFLPHRGTPAGDSDRSWTVDVKERKATAAEKAGALRKKAQEPAAEAARLADQIKAARQAAKADPGLAEGIEAMEARRQERRQAAKRLLDRAQRIEDGVYDLNAVNPNAAEETDDRSPEVLIEVIDEQGRRVNSALARLRALTSGADPSGDGAAPAVTDYPHGSV